MPAETIPSATGGPPTTLSRFDVVTSDGAQLTAAPTGLKATDTADAYSVSRAYELGDDLKRLAQENLAAFRIELGRIQRQVSGYHLANLLP